MNLEQDVFLGLYKPSEKDLIGYFKNDIKELANMLQFRAAQPIQTWLLYLICGLVDKPEEVKVDIRQGEQTTVFDVRVAKEDVGRLLGKQGRTVTAIRTLLSCTAAKHKIRCVLEVCE